jgi:hypothetical protein
VKHAFRFSLCLACLAALATAQCATAQSKLEGAWKTAEIVASSPDGLKGVNVPSALIIFTKGHYSMMYLVGEIPRPELPPKPTDTQLVEAWRPFMANSGSYELKGTRFTLHPLLAKDPKAMKSGNYMTFEFEITGNRLHIKSKENSLGFPPDSADLLLDRIE